MAIEEISQRAQRVFNEAIVIDMCQCLYPATDKDVGYFKKAADAGVTAIHSTILYPADDLPSAVAEIAAFYRLVGRM